jgi:hypothetical protein
MREIRYDYRYFNDMKFSGFYEFTWSPNEINKYLIFINFDNKMYIDIENIGSIIMPYDQFINNEYLKKYYELSMLLMKKKNLIIEKNDYTGIKDWFLDCAYILNKRVEKGTYYCYCNINPYDLKQMDVSTDDNIKIFINKVLNIDYNYDENIEKLVIDYVENEQDDSD